MTRKLIVGNWKMYPTLADSLVLAASFKKSLEDINGVEVVLAPPTAWLVPVIEAWRHPLPHVSFAAQNVWSDDQGAYTGETSAYLLKNIIDYAIVGHSERRRYGGEDNDLVHQKVQACLKWGIKPILCVGEPKKMIDAEGRIDSYLWQKVAEQLLEGIAPVKADQLSKVTVAYEPIWEIGTTTAAEPEYILQVIAKLKEKLAEKYGAATAGMVRFLYGGSVTADNASGILRYSDVGGLLVGGASVKAKDFLQICRLAAKSV